MELKNSLYKIIGINRDSQIAQIELLRECAIYKAHFPEQPITPGVCIIQIATELLKEILDLPLSLKELVNAKFLSVINPVNTISCSCQFQKLTELPEDRIKVSAIFSDESTVYAKLSLIYAKYE